MSLTLESLFAANELSQILLSLCINHLDYIDVINLACSSKTMKNVFKRDKHLQDLLRASVTCEAKTTSRCWTSVLRQVIDFQNLFLFKKIFPVMKKNDQREIFQNVINTEAANFRLNAINFILTFKSTWSQIARALFKALKLGHMDAIVRLYNCEEIVQFQNDNDTKKQILRIDFEKGTFGPISKRSNQTNSLLWKTGKNHDAVRFLIDQGIELESAFKGHNRFNWMWVLKKPLSDHYYPPIGLFCEVLLRTPKNDDLLWKSELKCAISAASNIRKNFKLGSKLVNLLEGILDRMNPLNYTGCIQGWLHSQNGDFLELLRKKKFIDPNYQSVYGQNLLFSPKISPAGVKMLVKCGANLNHFDHNGRTPLLNAIVRNNYSIEILLEQGANPHVREKSTGNTILHLLSIYYRSLDMVHTLVEKYEVDINAANDNGETPLDIYLTNARKNWRELFRLKNNVKAFIKLGAKLQSSARKEVVEYLYYLMKDEPDAKRIKLQQDPRSDDCTNFCKLQKYIQFSTTIL